MPKELREAILKNIYKLYFVIRMENENLWLVEDLRYKRWGVAFVEFRREKRALKEHILVSWYSQIRHKFLYPRRASIYLIEPLHLHNGTTTNDLCNVYLTLLEL